MATRRPAAHKRAPARASEEKFARPAKSSPHGSRARGPGAQVPAWGGNTVSRLEAAQRGVDEEDVMLDSYLSSLKLARKHTPKDGACLFRAVAEHVYHTQALHGVVREECVEYLQEHHKDFAAFICVNGRPYDDYVNKMRKPTTWGGEVELQALSNRYRANFEIYQLGEQVMKINNGFSTTYQLCFSHGNHYDIVYPERTMNALALCQSLVYDLVSQAQRRSGGPPPALASAAAAAAGGGWTYRNVELECWIEESRKQEMEDILLAQTLALNGAGTQYNGAGEASSSPTTGDGEGEFQRVGSKKKKMKAPLVSNTHSFPALRSRLVEAAVAQPAKSKAPEYRGPSSVEHVFRTVAAEESPWVLKRRQQQQQREEHERQQQQQQQQREEEEKEEHERQQQQQQQREQASNPAAAAPARLANASSPAATGSERKQRIRKSPDSTAAGHGAPHQGRPPRDAARHLVPRGVARDRTTQPAASSASPNTSASPHAGASTTTTTTTGNGAPPPSSSSSSSTTGTIATSTIATTTTSSSSSSAAAAAANKWGAKKDWKQHLESAPPRKPPTDGSSHPPASSLVTTSASSSSPHAAGSSTHRSSGPPAARGKPTVDAATSAGRAPSPATAATGSGSSRSRPLANVEGPSSSSSSSFPRQESSTAASPRPPEGDVTVPLPPAGASPPPPSSAASTTPPAASAAPSFTWAALLKATATKKSQQQQQQQQPGVGATGSSSATELSSADGSTAASSSSGRTDGTPSDHPATGPADVQRVPVLLQKQQQASADAPFLAGQQERQRPATRSVSGAPKRQTEEEVKNDHHHHRHGHSREDEEEEEKKEEENEKEKKKGENDEGRPSRSPRDGRKNREPEAAGASRPIIEAPPGGPQDASGPKIAAAATTPSTTSSSSSSTVTGGGAGPQGHPVPGQSAAKYSPSIPLYLGGHAREAPLDEHTEGEALHVPFSFGAFQQQQPSSSCAGAASKVVVEGVDLEDIVNLDITFGEFGASSSSASSPVAAAAAGMASSNVGNSNNGAVHLLPEMHPDVPSPNHQPAITSGSRKSATGPRHVPKLASSGARGSTHGVERAKGVRGGKNASAVPANGNQQQQQQPHHQQHQQQQHHHAAPLQQAQRGGGSAGRHYYAPGGVHHHYGVPYGTAHHHHHQQQQHHPHHPHLHQSPPPVYHPYAPPPPPPHGAQSPPPHSYHAPFHQSMPPYADYPVYYPHHPPPPYAAEFVPGPAAGFGAGGYSPYHQHQHQHQHDVLDTYGMAPHYEGGYNPAYDHGAGMESFDAYAEEAFVEPRRYHAGPSLHEEAALSDSAREAEEQ